MEYIKPKDKSLSPEYIEGHFVGWNSAMEIWAKRFEEEKARFQSRLTAETKRANEAEGGVRKIGNMCVKFDHGEMGPVAVIACIESLLIDYGFNFPEE